MPGELIAAAGNVRAVLPQTDPPARPGRAMPPVPPRALTLVTQQRQLARVQKRCRTRGDGVETVWRSARRLAVATDGRAERRALLDDVAIGRAEDHKVIEHRSGITGPVKGGELCAAAPAHAPPEDSNRLGLLAWLPAFNVTVRPKSGQGGQPLASAAGASFGWERSPGHLEDERPWGLPDAPVLP